MSDNRPNVADPGRIMAHRGASMVAPENTLGAFRQAHRQGAHWLEFDVSLLGDGTAVIHHDATLDRCTNRTGPLSAISAADLPGIEAGPGEGLPTLEQTLDLVDELGLYANLEMKPHKLAPGTLSAAVARALRTRPWAATRVITSSFWIAELTALRAEMPDAPLAAIYRKPPKDWPEVLARLDAAALHLRYSHISQSLLDTARRLGLDVRVFTVNDPGLLAPFRSLGLTGVITDHPPYFLDDPDWRAWAEA